MSFRPLALPALLAGLLAVAPLFAAEPAKPATAHKLSDAEVRALLERNELPRWESAVAARASLSGELERAKRNAAETTVPAIKQMKGFESETPEQRKAKAEKLVKDLAGRLAVTDRTLDAMREIALARVKAASYSVACPVRALPEAMNDAGTELRAAAVAAGYRKIAVAGVFVPFNGVVVSDSALTEALRVAFTDSEGPAVEGAPAFSGDALKLDTPGKTAVVVAQILPFPGLGGVLWSVRLVDAATFRVVAASASVIPAQATPASGKKAPAREKLPDGYEIVVRDRSNFVARLGASVNHSFGVEGAGVEAALLRVALASRAAPALNDYAFLASVLDGPVADPVSKALWVVRPGADGRNFSLGARLVGGQTTAVAPVGEVAFVPVVAKPGRN